VDQQTFEDTVSTLRLETDHVWILSAGLFCFFLQAGFGLLEAGALRAKNAKNIMLKNLMDACVGGVVYYLFGYAFAYGSPGDGTGNAFSGGESSGYFMLVDVAGEEYYIFFFQYVFAATIATIVSGAVAERIQFKAYMIYSAVLTGIVYPICSHWIWSSDGFLNKWGVIDYAGGGAVHALSGVAAFMGALALGPRIGKFVDGKPVDLAAHNVSMMALGVFILWLGFIPFNAGSGVGITGFLTTQTARIAVMTTLGGCSGGCVALLYGWLPWQMGHFSIEYAMNGILAGMVSVCSCCAVVKIWAVFWFIAPVAVVVYYGLLKLLLKIGVDDPLGASALHFGPGLVGLIAVGFFGEPGLTEGAYSFDYGTNRKHHSEEDFIGIFYGGNGTQLGFQVVAALIFTAYGVVTCGLLFYGMKFAKILRVTEEDELMGLDLTHHGGPAYYEGDAISAVKSRTHAPTNGASTGEAGSNAHSVAA